MSVELMDHHIKCSKQIDIWKISKQCWNCMLSYCTTVYHLSDFFLLSLSSSLRPGSPMNAKHHPNYCIHVQENSSIPPSEREGNKPSTSTFWLRNQTSKCPLKSNLSQSIWLSDNDIDLLGPISVSLESQRDVWLV